MPEFKIRMPDGQIKTVSGPNREGAMAFAKANYRPSATTAPEPEVNRSLADGLEFGDLNARANVAGYLGDANQELEAGPIGSVLNLGTEYIARPIRGALGLDTKTRAEIAADFSAEQALREKNLRKASDDLNYTPMTTADVTGIPSAIQFAATSTAESIGPMVAALASGGSLTPLLGAGEVNNNLKDIEGLSQEDRVRLSTAGGAIYAVLENLGIGMLLKGVPKEVVGKLGTKGVTALLEKNGLGRLTKAVTAGFASEAVTEAAQEGVSIGAEAIAGKEFEGGEIGDRLFEAGAKGGAGGGTIRGSMQAGTEVANIGKTVWSENMADPEYGAAASDLARLLRSISDNEGLNLKDVNTQGAAKQTLEAAHEQISGQIKAIVSAPGVRERLSPKNAETLDQLLEDYAAAQTAVRQGKNKVKSKVTDENAQAIARLLGPTKEAGQLLNLFDQGNVLTDLFADGTKGGVSQFTDYLNPLQNDGGGGFNVYRGLNVLGGVAGATQFGIPATAGIVAGGRLIDAATGRRSKVNRFVKKLEKLTGQKAPEGPSLIAAAALEKQQAEQAKADDAAAKEVQAQVKAAQEAENANITGTLAGMTGNATDGSPLGTIAVGTGIPTEEIQTVVSELRLKHPADSKNPQDVAVNKVLDDAQAGLNGEQRPIRALTQLVNLVNNHLDASLMDGGSSVQRTSLPDGDLARAKAIQMGNAPKMDAAPAAQTSPAPNVDTAAPAQPTVNGNQTTTSENYQAGIDANRTEGLRLQAQLLDTPNLPDTELEALYTALEAVQTENMPLAAMEDVAQLLVDEGVAQENVDKFYKPYIDRVRLQQKRKPSMLKQAQATQEAMADKPIADDSRSVPEEGIYVDKPAPAADDSRTPNITAPQITQPTALGPKTILVEGQIKPEEQQGPRNTNHGLLPHLRTTAPARDGKSVILASTKNANAVRQIEGLTEVLSRHDDPAGSPEAWSAYQGDALATSDVPVQPNGFINDLNNGGAQELLGKLTPGQIADADHGFENAANFRQAYINNEIGIADTGRLFLWSFLSRGVSPYTQESLFLDSFEGIDQWIEAAANKTLKERLPEYKAWAAQTAPQGSGQPGAGAMHNLNAFGVDFLMKMSQDVSPKDNRSRLQYIHDLMSDPNTTGNQVRREFTKIGEGVGIDNKVVSFTLLVAGYNDVMVLDRVQIRQMYNDGRFDGINLYDGYKEKDPKDGKSKVVTGSGLATQTNGAKGLMIYEAMEKSLSQRLPKIYGDIGRPDAASVGRYHWETWVASSEQEASHGTIDAILAKAQGDPNPLDGVTAKEGEYGAYAYGAKYGLENGQPMFTYNIPDRGEFKFTVPDFRTFLDEIKKPKNKVVPAKFSVSNSGNAPWYTRDGVNLDALAEKATEYGNQVSRTDGQLRQDQAVPDGRQPDAPGGSDNSIISNLLNPPGNTSGRTSRPGTGRPTKGPSLARVALTAVKRFVPQSKAAFQVGKRGTPYENGVQTLDQAVDLAHTLGITVRLFDSQEEMYASRSAFDPSANPSAVASFYQRGAYADGKGAEGTVFGLNPGSMLDSGGSVSGIDALSSLIHEIAHGMTLSPLDLNGSQVTDTEFTNPVTGQPDKAPMGSFAGSALRPLLEGKGDPDIMSEIDNLQMNVDAHTTNDPAQRSALREVRKLSTNLKDWKAYYDREVDNGFMSRSDAEIGMANRQDVADGYTDYMQSVRELAVDPVLIYLINPKLAKSVMPKTAALIREQFNNAGNKKVKFFSHPAAVVIATVMAMLAQGMAEEEEEKQRMQMPPGALTPPPPGMGALTV